MYDAIFIMGPTGVGKTKLLSRLRKVNCFFVINVDSVQIYKNLRIGSALPTPFEKIGIDYFLSETISLDEKYSAARFYRDCGSILKEKSNIGRLPFFVGGTGLYFRAIEEGLSSVPKVDSAFREKVEKELENMGLAFLYEKLVNIDPLLASNLHPHDRQRIIRGLEVYEATEKPLSSFHSKETKVPLVKNPLKIVIHEPNKNLHHDRLAKRFDNMLEFGLINEVKLLLQRNPVNIHSPGLNTVGYRQVVLYLMGIISFSEMREQAIKESKQLAKRQMTWFKKERNVIWVESNAIDDALVKIMVDLDRYEIKN